MKKMQPPECQTRGTALRKTGVGPPFRTLPYAAIQDGINGNQHRINGNWIMNLSISLLL